MMVQDKDRLTFSRLHHRLASIDFDGWDGIREEDVYSGTPHCYALFMRSIFYGFPLATRNLLQKYSWLCIEGNDSALGQAVLRLMRTEYGYKSLLTPAQFKMFKFASAKMNICVDLYDYLQKASNTHSNKKPKASSSLVRYDIPTENSLIKEEAPLQILFQRLEQVEERKRHLAHLRRA